MKNYETPYYEATIKLDGRTRDCVVKRTSAYNSFLVAFGSEEMMDVRYFNEEQAKAIVKTCKNGLGDKILADQAYWSDRVNRYLDNPEYFD